MARIRSIKPEFFRHELLQDLESANPKKYPMLVFAGLWTQADKNGVFPWRPRYLKLDILPFLDFDISKTLEILHEAKLIGRFTSGESEYGVVVTFEKHQRITGKEATDGERYPTPNGEIFGKNSGSDGEATEKQLRSDGEATGKQLVAQERKGKEREKERITPKKQGVNGIKVWIDASVEAGREKPIITGPVKGIAGKLAASFENEDDLRKIMVAFLKDTDKFLCDNGHAITLLPSRIEKYRNDSPPEHDYDEPYDGGDSYGILSDRQRDQIIAEIDRDLAKMEPPAEEPK